MSKAAVLNKGAWSEKINNYPLKTRAKKVLAKLMSRADRENLDCFPSIKTISEDCGMSIPTVQRALNDLVEFGVVEKIYRFEEGTGRQTSNLYKLKLEPEKPKDTNKSIQKPQKKTPKTPEKINTVKKNKKAVTQNKVIIVPEYKKETLEVKPVFESPKLQILYNIDKAKVHFTAKYIAERLLQRADKKDLTCFPNLNTIMEDTNLSKQTIRKGIKALIECGLIEKTSRFDKKTKRQTSNLYKFMLDPKPVPREKEMVSAEDDTKKVDEVLVNAKKAETRKIELEKVFEIKAKRLKIKSQSEMYKALIKESKNNKDLICHPRSKKLEAKYSSATTEKAIKELLSKQLLKKERTIKNTNQYKLVIVSNSKNKNNRTIVSKPKKSANTENTAHKKKQKRNSKINSINTS